MIVQLEEAQNISLDITEADILALEQAIIKYTNNDFRSNISLEIMQVDEDGLNVTSTDAFMVDDTVEVRGTTFEDGLAYITSKTDTHLSISLSGRGAYPIDSDSDAKVYLLSFPPDVRDGAKQILKQKIKAMTKAGIKSESVGRMSVTYANVADSQDSIYGLDAAYFSFLDPYRKLNWL